MVYETGDPTVDNAAQRALDDDGLGRADGAAPIAQPVELFAAGIDYIRSVRSDETVDTCLIVSAKAGDCAEGCGFCAQSVHFDTDIEMHGFLGAEAVLDVVRRAEHDDAWRFGIIVAERGVSKEHRSDKWADVLEVTRLVHDKMSVEIDTSFGLLTREGA